MLDPEFVRANLDAVERNIAARNMKVDVRSLPLLLDRRKAALAALEAARARRNAVASQISAALAPAERAALIDEGKGLKETIAGLESQYDNCDSAARELLLKIPNMVHPDAPVGRDEGASRELKVVGTPRQFDFPPLDHVELGCRLDIVDFEAGAKVSGPKFYFLKNEGVFLELALSRYVLNLLQARGFTPYITPDIARDEILEGIGFSPRGAESNIYALEGTGTCLVGTAEITLGGLHADSILDLSGGPIRMAGLSHCFRREAGAAGQFSKGLYRVHQFSKVEMFMYCTAEDSDRMHEELREIEESIFSSLEIPFRVIDTATGDLGAPAYRKYDLEAWMPGRNGGAWGEVTSTSNCTSYQARRLNIRHKDKNGKNQFVHMLNGTAVAISRAIICILENFQEADGSVRIPGALVPHTGFEWIRPK